jgi:outer membrane protein assembly factor BamA
MRRSLCVVVTAAAVCLVSSPALAQKFVPKVIKFVGDPEYSTQELMAASGLKSGEILGFSEMGTYSQKLLASGVFASVAFKFDGQDLTFLLAPSPDLYPVRLDNLPLAPGADLDAKLHAMVPLYHGKVPGDGALKEDLRAAFEKLLAEQGIEAQISVTDGVDRSTHKVNAEIYSIASPPVLVGTVSVTGVSPELAPEVQKVVNGLTNRPFDTANSGDGLDQEIEALYQDQGYAAVKVEADHAGAPAIAPDAVRVPFSVHVDAGRRYKLAAIHLPDGAPMTQEEIATLIADRPGAPPDGTRLRNVWTELSSRYMAKGFLDCRITPHPQLNDAAGTVSYTVDVAPGPVYRLGFVRFDNVTDGMRRELMRNWQMMPGDVFDKTYVSQFIFKAQQQDPKLRLALLGVKASINASADPQTHTVNLVIRLSQSPGS